MSGPKPRIVVAGHICLDLIPVLRPGAADDGSPTRIEPGQLLEAGPVHFSTGGAVANTGLALHRLGLPTTLAGKVGEDLFGSKVLQILRSHSDALADGMLTSPGEATSYTIVISPANTDRSFLHCPGANNTLTPEDLNLSSHAGAALFHFGYPPLMKAFFEDGGERARGMFRAARDAGMITSLDMALPDPDSPGGRVDWGAWLDRVLPEVDIFLPSIDEACFMLGVENNADACEGVGTELLAKGAAIVLLKLGELGLDLRSNELSPELAERLRVLGADALLWSSFRSRVPAFKADARGTTGAGDSAIAGFLAGVVSGDGPVETLELAAAVGACSVEAADATTGIPPIEEVRARIAGGWERLVTKP